MYVINRIIPIKPPHVHRVEKEDRCYPTVEQASAALDEQLKLLTAEWYNAERLTIHRLTPLTAMVMVHTKDHGIFNMEFVISLP